MRSRITYKLLIKGLQPGLEFDRHHGRRHSQKERAPLASRGRLEEKNAISK